MPVLRVIFVGASLALLSACASQVPVGNNGAASSTGSGAMAGSSTGAANVDQIAAAKAALSKVKPSIYFDFDKFDIKSDYQPNINAFANYLKVDAKARLVVEGNADERGTTEYNLALGQKRAEAVRKALGALGVAANRVESISNGEEKPRAKGSNESAWAENRRADMMLK